MPNVSSDLMSKANGPAKEFKNKVFQPEGQIEQFAHAAGERIGTFASDVADSTSDYARAGRDYVRENPAKSIAAAALAGVLAGSILTIAMRKSQS